MKLKPVTPWAEFLVFGLITYFSIKLILLAIDKSDFLIFIPVAFLLTIIFYVAVWVNKEYRSYELAGKLRINGYFWGRSEIEFLQLSGYKVRERREGKYLIKVNDIILLMRGDKQLIIQEGNYEKNSVILFKDILKLNGVEYCGVEKFSWSRSFSNLLKLKIFD